jgi:hypothetical protein
LFFTNCLARGETPNVPHQLFLRLAGSRTLEVSRPLEAGAFGGCDGEGIPGEVPCQGAATRPSADFAGASEDGSRVYFTTAAQLASSDTDSGNDLYMATIGCPASTPGCAAAEREVTSMTQVSHDPNGGAAEVLGVVRLAPDGSRVYFVAKGDLLTQAQRQALESEGRPVPQMGAANLYAYDTESGGTVAFVGDLCTGEDASAGTQDASCPGKGSDALLWSGAGEFAGESQSAGADARFLLFATYAQLTGDDNNSVRDVYRYDADTGALTRVSIGEDGYDANGNAGTAGSSIMLGNHGTTVVKQYGLESRAISEDGSRIVFLSAEKLSPLDSNGLVNAYEWHEGSVSLVSSGSDEEPVEDVVISPNGQNIFFDTVQGLVPQDTDGAPDVYDARLGPGFPPAETASEACEGDACQGPLTNPAAALVPGSALQAPGENLTPPTVSMPKQKPSTRKRPAKVCRTKRGRKRSVCKAQGRKRHGKQRARKSSVTTTATEVNQ